MKDITIHKVGIIMNGVTGRMGTNQHLMRSIVEIIKQGGVKVSEKEFIMPDPILIGRNQVKLRKLTEMSGITKTATDLDSVLADPAYSIYFDAQTTDRRPGAVKKAIAAGKHIYCEKPTALSLAEALELYQLADKAGLKNGVVQDKLWLPGFVKLKMLIDQGFFGRILSVRGEFGYWVFEGDITPAQRPSWNYRKEDGGGIVLDMLPHWRYVVDNIFGNIKSLSCLSHTQRHQLWHYRLCRFHPSVYQCAYATLELDNGVIVHINSSWDVRVRRDDLLTFQVDGTKGSAVAGLRKVYVQPAASTPKPVWNPDIDQPIKFFDGWMEMPDTKSYENAFKIQWELFLKHVVKGDPYEWTLLAGAKGVQLAELAYESSEKRAWVDVADLG